MQPSARRLTAGERALISHLWAVNASGNVPPPDTFVEDMNDGGMGSLSFVSSKRDRSQGEISRLLLLP